MSISTVTPYLSVADANEYFKNRLGAEFWTKVTDQDRSSSLIMATRNINRLPFIGKKIDDNQVNSFPRKIWSKISSSYESQSKVPQDVIDACCEEALFLLMHINDDRLAMQALGVKRGQRGNIAEEYSGVKRIVQSPDALSMLSRWICRIAPIDDGKKKLHPDDIGIYYIVDKN